MAEISLFGLGNQAKSPNLTAAHRLNVFYDVQVDGDKTTVAAYGTPGLNLFSSVSGNPTRGIHWMESNSQLYVVQRGTLYEITTAGVVTSRGTLAVTPTQDISGYVSMANNGTELAIATGAYFYIYNTVTHALTTVTLPFTGGADTVTFLDGYFLVNRPATGQFFKSAAYDGLTWGALDFATAESNPDNLKAVCADKGMLVLFGALSTEIWANTGAQLFPFERVNGAPSEAGLASTWSLSRAAGSWTGLFKNRQGALTIAQLNGYSIEPISNADLDYIINRYQDPANSVGFGYSMNGKAFYQITFITDEKTWLYDFASKAWSQLKSWGINRHTGDLGAAFDTSFIVTDYATGQLYTLSADAITDNGQPIEREITGKHTFATSRNNLVVRRLRVDLEGGVGLVSGQGENPQIMLQISRDNGHTWGAEMWCPIGRMGEFTTRAEWRRLGQARDWIVKLRITDPVKTVIISAIAEVQELNK